MDMAFFLQDILPVLVMFVAETADVGVTTVTKVAMTDGLSTYVFVLYSNALGTILLIPYLILKRNKLAPMSVPIFGGFLLVGLMASVVMVVAYTGVRLSSPTLSSALSNLVPIFTFLIAVALRMEKLDLRQTVSQAKSLGAIVTLSGALLVTLYKGPPVFKNLLSSSPLREEPHVRWVLGGFLITVGCIPSALCYILQAYLLKRYPYEVIMTCLSNFFITIFSAIYALIAVRDPEAWKLKSNTQIMAVIFSAVVGSIFRTTVYAWCLRKKGPFFVAMFKPVSIVIAVVMAIIFLGDTIYAGNLLGSFVVAVGFYTVMWARVKEKDDGNVEEAMYSADIEPATQRKPLLTARTAVDDG